MLHKPKISTLKHLHSIPRYFMHSIPIGSLVALLTLTLFTINPSPHSNIEAYAIEDTNVRDTISTNNSNSDNNDLDTVEREDSTVSKADDDSNSEISTQANTTPTASLTIGGAGLDEVVPASAGEIAYRKHTITVNSENNEEYYLVINGPTSLAGTTAIVGANNNTPVDMPDNSWGYAYSDTNTADTLHYQSFTNNPETIDSGTGPANFTKNLIFAAKFGNDAASGHYTGQVTLSLASTPIEVVLPTDPVNTWDELQYLQQIGNGEDPSDICSSIPIGETKIVKDSRDDNNYSIAKLGDGHCWMTSNLRLTKESIKKKDPSNSNGKLTNLDSNIKKNLTFYLANTYNFTKCSDETEALCIYYDGDTTRGAYYSLCEATANYNCSSIDNEETSNDPSNNFSICPKGWRLPKKDDYSALAKVTNFSEIVKPPYSFIYAGFVDSEFGTLFEAGNTGEYWSRTIVSGNYYNYKAYSLVVDGESLIVNSNSGRSNGLSVRCVAI